jgi:hypothetical protein
MTDAPNSISYKGVLRNMLESGFDTQDCIGEKVDDSSGAGAKHIAITVESKEKQLFFADDACGMDKEGLKDHGTLHNRKPPSNKKQGRYGIGGNHAEAEFTQLQGSSLTLTKCEVVAEDPLAGMYELTLDYKKAVETNTFPIMPHGMTAKNEMVWKKRAIDPKATGTVKIFNCPSEMITKLKAMTDSKTVGVSLRYHLGSSYFKEIQDGLVMRLTVDGVTHTIAPIDPLCWNAIPTENKREMVLSVFVEPKTGETRVYFTDKKGVRVRRVFNGPGKRNSDKNVDETAQKGWKHVGNVTIRSAFCKDWAPLQKDALAANGIMPAPKEGDDGVQDFRQRVGGIKIMRNDRIIANFPIPKPTSGDKGRYDYITTYARHLVQFRPMLSDAAATDTDLTLDSLFGVMVNKSKLEKRLIKQQLWETIEWLCLNDFAHSFYAKEKKLTVSESEESSESEEETVIVTAPAPVIQKIVAATKLATLAAPKPVVAPPPAPAPAPPPAPAPAPPPAPAPAPPPRPAPAPVNTKTVVEAHERMTSKSPKEVITLAIETFEAIAKSNIKEVIAKASNKTETGLTEKFRDILGLRQWLEQQGVKF